MKLVWKLLRQHISLGQFAGFVLANLVGLLIILLSFQFYRDIQGIFSSRDSFMKEDYLVVSKKLGQGVKLTGKSGTFSAAEISDLKKQGFTESVGVFTPADFQVSGNMGLETLGLQFGSEMFFESVPDDYVDYSSDQWDYQEGDTFIPIILPRNYLNLYNFGYAQTRGLPKISENVIGMVSLDITLKGEFKTDSFKGSIVGFSNRLNTILVPQKFMDWANDQYGTGQELTPSRLILAVKNPTDDAIVKYFEENNYETEADKLDQGKTTWFLKLMVGAVMLVGALISALALYILMLSIYLLVQKNTNKLENLLLIGYSPRQVAAPYQLLTVGLNLLVLVLAIILLTVSRGQYLALLQGLYPGLQIPGLGTTLLCGVGIFVVVSLVNLLVIQYRVTAIWKRKE